MTPTVYLTVDQVKELHRDAIEQFGGLDGVRAEQQLYSALAQVQQSAFGEDAYPTIPEKAAAYGYFTALRDGVAICCKTRTRKGASASLQGRFRRSPASARHLVS
jgi:hypothetical protein